MREYKQFEDEMLNGNYEGEIKNIGDVVRIDMSGCILESYKERIEELMDCIEGQKKLLKSERKQNAELILALEEIKEYVDRCNWSDDNEKLYKTIETVKEIIDEVFYD